MNEFKLVPMEPTEEMATAAMNAEIHANSVYGEPAAFSDIWWAMLSAAPAVQGEPVAYAVFAGNGNLRIWCADPVQVETLRQQYGEALQPLYAHPQPAEQQPVEGEEIMVDTPYDVFTLPLQPSGLGGKGPRFVVHVPGPGQPAAPDVEALVEALQGLLNIVSDSSGVAGYHLNGNIADWDEFEEVENAEVALSTYSKQGAEE